jgi:DNA (cytosine-5)-methyltransferase 1
VREVLDLADYGRSIFAPRKKPWSEKTLQRVLAGLIKFVAKGDKGFIAQYYSGRPEGKVRSLDTAHSTVTTVPHESLVQPVCIMKFLSNNAKTGINAGASLDAPSHTVTTQVRMNLLSSEFIMQNNQGTAGRASDLDTVAKTITASGGQLYLVNSQFLTQYNGGGVDSNVMSLDSPSRTITTHDNFGFIHPQWIDRQYGNGTPYASLDMPGDTLVKTPKQSLVSAYLMNPQYTNSGGSIDNPCFTLIARMDKMPPYIVSTEQGYAAIAVYSDDSETMILIKQFMAAYGIVDIFMRMLKVSELKRITGFGDDYVLLGTEADKKKQIGNAVPPLMAQRLIENFYETNEKSFSTTLAAVQHCL